MNAGDARKLYAYTDWANERMLAVIEQLPEEQFTREIVSSFSSIRDTLAHIAFAEWLWLRRWKGESPREYPSWTKGASFAELAHELRTAAADRRAYLDAVEDIDATISYVSTEGDPFTMPLGEVLIHCANHSTYHRGQLATMLRQVGATPPNMDYSRFARG